MRIQLRWVGMAIIVSLFLGFFSVRIDTSSNQPPPNEIATKEINLVKPILGTAEFAMFWRDVHDPVGAASEEVGAEPEDTTKEGSWRLVGVVVIDAEETAYLLTSDDELVVVKEGEEFGGNYLATEIKKKSLNYKNPEHENRVLRLYGTGSEVEL